MVSQIRPVLDPEFIPAILWNRDFLKEATEPLAIALERSDGSVSVYRTKILAPELGLGVRNSRYVERLLKFLLWQKGGWRVTVGGSPEIAEFLRGVYAPGGSRAFDYQFMGGRVYGRAMTIENCPYHEVPDEREAAAPLGRHLEGYRIGFDLGASDRKCAAVAHGEVIF